jgi:nucleotide-binding universal stress UspA family protein
MKNVLVGVDFSPLAKLAMDAALEIVASRAETKLHVVHVAKSLGPMVRLELEDDERSVSPKEAASYLQDYVERHLTAWQRADRKVDGADVSTHVRVGAASTEIVQLGADLDADIIVVGTEGRSGVERFLLGSVAETVVHKAGCPVWVVREKTRGREAS